MASAKPRRLIINADDFGRSSSINQAVIDAHRRGVLTSASLMVTGEAFEEAALLARETPTLAVGLHLTLCCGFSALPHSQIPGLVDEKSRFSNSPVRTGLRYYFQRSLRDQLKAEIAAQFERFQSTGLPLDHLNGHLHFHLHPKVATILKTSFRFPAVRRTREPFALDFLLGRGRWFYRFSHSLVFGFLARKRWQKVAQTDFVFGLLQNGQVTEEYLLKLLPALPPGDSELYSHPSLSNFRHEYEALLSPRVRQALSDERIQLIQYRDLWRNS